MMTSGNSIHPSHKCLSSPYNRDRAHGRNPNAHYIVKLLMKKRVSKICNLSSNPKVELFIKNVYQTFAISVEYKIHKVHIESGCVLKTDTAVKTDTASDRGKQILGHFLPDHFLPIFYFPLVLLKCNTSIQDYSFRGLGR